MKTEDVVECVKFCLLPVGETEHVIAEAVAETVAELSRKATAETGAFASRAARLRSVHDGLAILDNLQARRRSADQGRGTLCPPDLMKAGVFVDEPSFTVNPVPGYQGRLEFRRTPSGGKLIGPFVHGTDTRSSQVYAMVKTGARFSEILRRYPGVQKSDIEMCINVEMDLGDAGSVPDTNKIDTYA